MTVLAGGGLPEHIVIVVPSTMQVTLALSEEAIADYAQRAKRFLAERFGVADYAQRAKRFLAERFGGSTAVRAQGSWLSSSGALIDEDVTYVFSFTVRLTDEDKQAVFGFAEQMREELVQEAVAVIINGVLYLI
jgi:hypothetical protein